MNKGIIELVKFLPSSIHPLPLSAFFVFYNKVTLTPLLQFSAWSTLNLRICLLCHWRHCWFMHIWFGNVTHYIYFLLAYSVYPFLSLSLHSQANKQHFYYSLDLFNTFFCWIFFLFTSLLLCLRVTKNRILHGARSFGWTNYRFKQK